MSITYMMRGWEYYKGKYEQIKPIRGRSNECKPLGKRSRDWETVTKDGEVYSAKLYNTECVRYHPNGDIQLRCESYSTPITASFIHEHSPFYCYKQYKKLWIRVSGEHGDRVYPIPEGNEGLTMRYMAGANGYVYEPTTPQVIQKQVIDRQKAKDARAPLKPFLDWAKTMHKLSDGWIMAETREHFGQMKIDNWRVSYDYGLPADVAQPNYWGGYNIDPKRAYEWIQNCNQDSDFMKMYMMLCAHAGDAEDKRLWKAVDNPQNKGHQIQIYDVKFKFDYLKRHVWKWAEESVDLMKIVEVEVGNKAFTGVR